MLSHNKVCELEDFSHPDLLPVIREVFSHERERFGDSFPHGREYRKYWEVAMAVRSLRAAGALSSTSDILGVGAGNEPTIFYLTNHVRRVFATDLYLASASPSAGNSGTDRSFFRRLASTILRKLPLWAESANLGMMLDPGRYWPREWKPRRLVVQHMNALDLQYEDASFDGIFSSSSLEHFGTPEQVRKSLREMARVLKPGGIASLSTEFRLSGSKPGLPGILMFDEKQVREWIIGVADWEPIDVPTFDVSSETMKGELKFSRALKELTSHLKVQGEVIIHRLTWATYPHIVLRAGEQVWTSIHLALRKRGN